VSDISEMSGEDVALQSMRVAMMNDDRQIAIQALGQLLLKCHRCGHCCKIQVRIELGPGELKSIQERYGKNKARFFKYDPLKKAHYLTGPCPFLRMDGELSACEIYDARPLICKAYPFLAPDLIDRAQEGILQLLAYDDCPAMPDAGLKMAEIAEMVANHQKVKP